MKKLSIVFLFLIATIKIQAQDAKNNAQEAEFRKFLAEYEQYEEKLEKGQIIDSSYLPLNCEEYELKWTKSHFQSPRNYFLSQYGGDACEKLSFKPIITDRYKQARTYVKTRNGRYIVIFEIWDISVFRQTEFYYQRKAKKD